MTLQPLTNLPCGAALPIETYVLRFVNFMLPLIGFVNTTSRLKLVEATVGNPVVLRRPGGGGSLNFPNIVG